jgi:hypothetical protein
MNQHLAQIEEIANTEDWIGSSAKNVLDFVNLYKAGELPVEAARHCLQTVQHRSVDSITLEEFERKNVLNNLIINVLNTIDNV